MIRKILVLIMVTCLLLTGCGYSSPDQRITVVTSMWTTENTNINIDDSYEFVDFDKNYNEDGTLTILINYKKK